MKNFRTRISLTFFITTLLVVIVVLAISIATTHFAVKGQLKVAKESLNEAVKEEVIRKTTILMQTMADNLFDPLYNYRFHEITRLLKYSANHHEIYGLYVTDSDWNLVHDGNRPYPDHQTHISAVDIIPLTEGERIREVSNGHLIFYQAIGDRELTLGYLVADVSTSVGEQYQSYLEASFSSSVTSFWQQMGLVYLATIALVLVLAFWVGKILSGYLVKPLTALAIAAERIGQGELEHKIPLAGDRELHILAEALATMQQKLQHHHHQERRLAYFDSVTALPNRHAFQKALSEQVEQRLPFALMFFDLDDFKKVNDTLGHAVGDGLLAAFGNRLLNGLKQQHQLDLPLYRIGGDEFVILLPAVEKKRELKAIGDTAIAVVSSPFVVDGQLCQIGVSVGGAFYPKHGQDRDTLLRHADIAMYKAKNGGKNRLSIYANSDEQLPDGES
ncbi:diguanylate cyclase [Ectothiorhodospiraceae bacterium BW-2]|nr:diguanylate cyclase [Ectothiorhodospiraceae bacterium BW-2]